MANQRWLPAPIVEIWAWQEHGACRRVDPAVFFHPAGERGDRKAARERAARTVCARCPVLDRCREHGLTVQEPYGVWGGLSEDDRALLYTGTPVADLPLPGLTPTH